MEYLLCKALHNVTDHPLLFCCYLRGAIAVLPHFRSGVEVGSNNKSSLWYVLIVVVNWPILGQILQRVSNFLGDEEQMSDVPKFQLSVADLHSCRLIYDCMLRGSISNNGNNLPADKRYTRVRNNRQLKLSFWITLNYFMSCLLNFTEFYWILLACRQNFKNLFLGFSQIGITNSIQTWHLLRRLKSEKILKTYF